MYFKNVRNFVQIHFMTKVLSVTEFRSNLAVELDHVGGNDRNQIIIKRPKGKGNVVVLSQDAFNSIVNIFEGQEICESNFTVYSPEFLVKQHSIAFNEIGYGNRLTLGERKLLENVQNIS